MYGEKVGGRLMGLGICCAIGGALGTMISDILGTGKTFFLYVTIGGIVLICGSAIGTLLVGFLHASLTSGPMNDDQRQRSRYFIVELIMKIVALPVFVWLIGKAARGFGFHL